MNECIKILNIIAKIKNAKTRKKILFDLDGDECFYKALREIALNTVNKNIKVPGPQRKKLQKYKKLIQTLSKPAKTRRTRKKLIIQSGGFLPLLIPAAISLLTTLIKK